MDRLGWRGDLRLQSKSAFSRFAAIHNSILKVGKGSDLTRSRSRRRMAGVCAIGTIDAPGGREPLKLQPVEAMPRIDVKRSQRMLTVVVSGTEQTCAS